MEAVELIKILQKEQTSIRYLFKMEIDAILYNIESRDDVFQAQEYIELIPVKSLQQVARQVVQRVKQFDPDDRNTVEQIRSALRLCQKLLINTKFNQLPICDESFICSLGFYIEDQKQTQKLQLALDFIVHQFIVLKQMAYSQSVNLFKALSQTYKSVCQQYYETLVNLMLNIVVNNLELLPLDNSPYHFQECLLQIINKQQNPLKLAKLLNFITTVYSVKKIQLLHEKDLKVLIDILIRIVKNQHQKKLIQETLYLYFILSRDITIYKIRYRANQMLEAIEEKFMNITAAELDPQTKAVIVQIVEGKSSNQ